MCCHFGGKWSAYWWGRVGAYLVRTLHRALWVPHQLWLYVDDFLVRLRREQAPLQAAYLALTLSALGVPLSWPKLKLPDVVDWIGYSVSLHTSAWGLPDDKIARMKGFCDEILAIKTAR